MFERVKKMSRRGFMGGMLLAAVPVLGLNDPLVPEMYPDAFEFIVRAPAPDSVVNYSYLNHKPAGKFGWLHNDNGDFVFENGEKVRFFGLNVVDERLFNMTNEEADTVAAKIAALGFNMVRLHHMTAAWQNAKPFFVDREASTLEFSDAALERLDYFCAALKRNGVYLTAEMVDSALVPNLKEIPDGEALVADQFKIMMMIDADLQEYVKAYMRKFYLRKNRYTNLSFFEDPQFALIGIVNEISMGYHGEGMTWSVRDYYYETLNKEFQVYLQQRNLPAKEFDRKLHDRDSGEFWNAKLESSYRMWMAFIRELGFKGLISGSNFGENAYHHDPSRVADFMDAHLYWGFAPWTRGVVSPVGNDQWSILLEPPFNRDIYTKQPFARFSLTSIPGYPNISSEHRTAAGGSTSDFGEDVIKYSEYRGVGLPFFATVQAFQEWDGYYIFASQGNERLNQVERMGHVLDIRHDTVCLGSCPLSAYLMRSKAIQPARSKVLMKYTREDIYSSEGRREPSFFTDVLFNLPEQHKVQVLYPGMSVDESAYDMIFDYSDSRKLENIDRSSPIIQSDTGEFYRNYVEGYFVVTSPLVQGVEGFFHRTQSFDLPDFTLKMLSDYGICFVAGRQDEPLAEAQRMMFFVGGEAMNTIAPGTSRQAQGWWNPGDVPVQLKPVKGILGMKRGMFRVWVLGEHGERKEKIAEATNHFEFDTGRDKTIFYELERIAE